jgi:UDP-N-acetyl-2-amino-2-deoxyglucuronate dehydrogenase
VTSAWVRTPLEPTIGIGFVGAGAIVDIHRAAIASIPGLQVVGVWSRRRPDGSRWTGLERFDDMSNLLASDAVDIVCVCSPSGLHGEHVLAALRAGKHVVAEKPLTLDPAEAAAAVRLARQEGLLLSYIAQSRYQPQAARLMALIRGGDLGRPVLAEALIRWHRDAAYYRQADWRGTWFGSGGVLANQGYHTIDLMCWAFGDVAEVEGIDAVLTHDIEAADTAVVAIRFENGALGVIAASTSTYPGRPECLNLFFDRGSVTLEGGRIVHWTFTDAAQPRGEQHVGGGEADPMAIGSLGHADQWTDIGAALRSGRDPLVVGEDALPVLRLLWTARRDHA